jgi:hypothetical protein
MFHLFSEQEKTMTAVFYVDDSHPVNQRTVNQTSSPTQRRSKVMQNCERRRIEVEKFIKSIMYKNAKDDGKT